jgi:hypothetical protein
MLNNIALGLLIFVVIFLFYAIIVVHDIPYEIAKKRKHPHQDAIHTAGWISLLTLHIIWPFLWIWATLYREDRGWGISSSGVCAADKSGNPAITGDSEAAAETVEGEPSTGLPREDSDSTSSKLSGQITALNDRIAELEARLDGTESGPEPSPEAGA